MAVLAWIMIIALLSGFVDSDPTSFDDLGQKTQIGIYHVSRGVGEVSKKVGDPVNSGIDTIRKQGNLFSSADSCTVSPYVLATLVPVAVLA